MACRCCMQRFASTSIQRLDPFLSRRYKRSWAGVSSEERTALSSAACRRSAAYHVGAVRHSADEKKCSYVPIIGAPVLRSRCITKVTMHHRAKAFGPRAGISFICTHFKLIGVVYNSPKRGDLSHFHDFDGRVLAYISGTAWPIRDRQVALER